MAPAAFDLDRFAPAPLSFTLTGDDKVQREYFVSGDPDVDAVGRMLRIEETISAASTTSAVEEIAQATREGKQLLIQMILDHDVDQDVSKVKLGTTQVLTLFSLILHGSSVAAIVASALTAPAQELGETGDGVATPGDDTPERPEDSEDAPLASASASSERSSSSESTGAGLPATGSD